MTFAETFIAARNEKDAFWKTAGEMQLAMQAERIAFFKKKFPRRKNFDYKLIADLPETAAMFAPWKEKADAITAVHKEAETKFEEELNRLALEESVPATPIMGQVTSYSASTYNSQGWGANRYAEMGAESAADTARFHGLQAEVMIIGTWKGHDGMAMNTYGVFVNTTEIGWEMVKLKPGPTLREWLKMCWKRGVNPRVYNPYLPAGLEDKLGIDYFGNDKVTG